MGESCAVDTLKNSSLNVGNNILQDDVVQQNVACAIGKSIKTEQPSKFIEGELPLKKRKTRRGKCKRRQPYLKNKNNRKSNKLVKPEAPRNSNQFLLEDHGLIEELDDNLKISVRHRDSSFSVDSDGDFYSSPDDEEQFLIKDFDDQYESLHAERLQAMSKNELIQEYLLLENKLEQLSKQMQDEDSEDSRTDLKQQIERLTIENERLKRENELLRKKSVSDSEDSETDSSSSCSSSSTCASSSCSSRSRSPLSNLSSGKTNGLDPSTGTVNPVQ